MPRLRRVRSSCPGIGRRRHGKGFSYRSADGRAVEDPQALEWIGSLGIPPAWSDVWICPDPLGHLQATGTDAAGRRQYLYHPDWRARRDVQKFRRIESFARQLGPLRASVERNLALDGMPRDRVLACAIRLLDQGAFRIGSESYAERNGSFGLATLRKSHVTLEPDRAIFDYTAKSGKRRIQEVFDPEVLSIVRELKGRTGGGRELLAYRVGSRWRDVRSGEINDHIQSLIGEEYSAKDFRTWQATVLAAVRLAVADADREPSSSERRIVTLVVKETADYLGNTPAVCRSSYIDPRVFERFRDGITIGDRLEGLEALQPPSDTAMRVEVEAAVLDLLEGALRPARAA